MAGPGGRVIGRVSIRVVPDVSQFSTQLKADLKKIEARNELKIPVVLDTKRLQADMLKAAREASNTEAKIKVDADTTKAKVEIDKAAADKTSKIHVIVDKTSLSQIKSVLGKTLGAVGTVMKGFSFVTLGATAVAASSQILTLVGSLEPLIGGLAALPAVILGAGAALGTIKLATSGLGDAFKAASKGGAEYQQALDKLAPSASNFVQTVQRLKPQFTALQQVVQQNFFAGFSQSLVTLTNSLLPQLRKGLAATATSMNGLARQTATSLSSAFSGGGLQTILSNTAKALAALKPAIDPIVKAFAALGVTGSQYLTPLAQWVTRLAQSFGQFIANASKTGQINVWIENAAAIVKQLGSAIGGVVKIFGGLINAAQKAGGGTIAALADGLNAVAKVVNSPTFQKGLVTVFQGAQAGAALFFENLAPIGKALAALAPTLATIAKIAGKTLGVALADIAKALANPALQHGLVQVFQGLSKGILALAPALQPIAQALGALGAPIGLIAEKLGPILATVLIAIANAVKVLAPALIPVVNGLAVLLSGVLSALAPVLQLVATTIANLLVTAMAALAPLLPQIVSTFTALAQTLVASLAPVLPLIIQLFAALLPIALSLIPVFLQMVQSILPFIPPVVQLVADLLPPLISLIKFLAPVLIILGAAFAIINSPILAVIAGTVALIAIIKGAISIVQSMSKFFTSAFNTVKSVTLGAMTAVNTAIGNAMSAAGRAVASAFSAIVRTVANAGVSVARAVASGFTSALNFVLRLDAQILSAVSHAFSSAASAIYNAMKTGAGYVGQWLQYAIGFFRNLPNEILGAIGDIGGLLFNAGKAVIQGFINGIKSMAGSVKNTLGSITHKLTSWKGPPSTDKVILRDNGRLVLEGFIKGIEDRIPDLRSSLGGVTDLVGATPASMTATVDSGSIQDAIIQGMSKAQVRLDGKSVTEVVNTNNLAMNRGSR